MNVLGIDVGTSSLGWVLLDPEKEEVIGSGTRIFKEGVKRDGRGKESSLSEQRREARQKRRQYFRKRMRRNKLIQTLWEQNLFPKVGDDLEDTEMALRRRVLPDVLSDFFKIDPYQARAKGFQGEKLSRYELGRCFFHLSQRRGYRANRKTDDEKEKGAIWDGKPQDGKVGIHATQKKVEAFGTLGNALYHLDSTEERVRNRYTLRKMYQDEFWKICEAQSEYHEFLTDAWCKKVHDIIFHQRPLRSQKHLLGKCTFEPDKPKCPLSHPLYEAFRTHQLLNNIRYRERELTSKQKAEAFAEFDTWRRGEVKMSKLFSLWKTPKAERKMFNYDEKAQFPRNKTRAQLRDLFGKNEWESKPESEREHIWHLFHATVKPEVLERQAEKWQLDKKQAEKVRKIRLAEGYANLSRKAIGYILPYLERGYGYSTATILGGVRRAFGQDWRELAPSEVEKLEDNVVQIVLERDPEGRKIKDRLNDYLQTAYALNAKQLKRLYHHSDLTEVGELQDELPPPKDLRNPVVNRALSEMRKLVNRLIATHGHPDRIRVEFAREAKSNKAQREEIQRRQRENEKKNTEAKAFLLDHDLPLTRWNIQKYLLWKECDKHCPYSLEEIDVEDLFTGQIQVEHIVPRSTSLNNSMSNKTLCLASWNQQKGNRTPYQAFGEKGDHWSKMVSNAFRHLPYHKAKRFVAKTHPDLDDFLSRQLNDTRYIAKEARMYLRAICADVQVVQGNTTSLLRRQWGMDGILSPSVYVGEQFPNFPEGAAAAAFNAEGELLALRSITEEPGKTVKSLRAEFSKKVKVREGQVLNNWFNPTKDRSDHRHHAVDAAVIACTEVRHLQQVAKWVKYREETGSKPDEKVPPPWKGFYTSIERSVRKILVSHQQRDRVISDEEKTIVKNGQKRKARGIAARGQLHKETVYGRRRAPNQTEYGFHVRKPLESLTGQAQVDKIVDPVVRKLVKDRLQTCGVNISKKSYKIPQNKEIFFHMDENGRQIPLLFLPNKKGGDPVPIRKVRIRESSTGAVKLKDEINQWVEPGNNYCVGLYKSPEGKLFEGEVVTFWTAVQRKIQQKPVLPPVRDDGSRLVVRFQEDDMFLMGLPETKIDWKNPNYEELSKYLYRVQSVSRGDYMFRFHQAANLDVEFEKVRIKSTKSWEEHTPIKVRVDELGRIAPWEPT